VKYFYWDYETFPIEPSLLAPPIVCMSYAYDHDPVRLVHVRPGFSDLPMNTPEHTDLELILWRALKDDNVAIVAHQAAYEILCTLAYRPSWVSLVFGKLRKGLVYCTITLEKQIRKARGDRTEGYGLDDLAAKYKVSPIPDKSCKWRTRYGELFEFPLSQWPQDAIDYSLGDIAAREIFRAQVERSNHAEYASNAHEVRSKIALALTSATGFPTDLHAAQRLYDDTVVKLEEYKQIVLANKLARWEVKGGQRVVVKTKAAAEARLLEAYAKQGRPPPRGEPTAKMVEAAVAKGQHPDTVEGNLKLDEEACELSGDPILLAYSKFGQAGTLLKKVRRPLIAAQLKQRIQCRYNELVATGRTSCSQGDDPEPGEPWTTIGLQMQNLPRVGAEIEADVT
jgi:hypothetical protein